MAVSVRDISANRVLLNYGIIILHLLKSAEINIQSDEQKYIMRNWNEKDKTNTLTEHWGCYYLCCHLEGKYLFRWFYGFTFKVKKINALLIFQHSQKPAIGMATVGNISNSNKCGRKRAGPSCHTSIYRLSASMYHRRLFKSHCEGVSTESSNVIFRFTISENMCNIYIYLFLHFIGSAKTLSIEIPWIILLGQSSEETLWASWAESISICMYLSDGGVANQECLPSSSFGRFWIKGRFYLCFYF